jgi:hypothetical protein
LVSAKVANAVHLIYLAIIATPLYTVQDTYGQSDPKMAIYFLIFDGTSDSSLRKKRRDAEKLHH